jgi:iron(III) transport system permease protein
MSGVIRFEKMIWGVVAVIVAYLILAPVGMLVLASFKSTLDRLPFEAGPFTFSNYVAVFTSHATYVLLLNSFCYATGSVILTMALACGFAWLLERTDIPMRSFLLALLLSPMAIPPLVLAMAWILLANPSTGLFNVVIRTVFGLTRNGPLNIYSIPGMIIVTSLTMVPSVYIMISGMFSRMDPALEEASEVSGVTPRGTFWHITVPLLRPAIVAGIIYYFILGLGIFEVPALLGLPKRIFVFSTLIFQASYPEGGRLPDYGKASGYAMLVFAITLVLLYFYGRLVKRREQFVVVTGRGYFPRLTHLSRGWRYGSLVAVLLYFFVAVVLPFLVLVWASLLPSFFSAPSAAAFGRMSFSNYTKIISYPGMAVALKNTALIALCSAIITMAISAIVSWIAARGRFYASSLPDHLTFLVVAIPGIVLALALRFVYLSLPLPVYGTIWIITIAHITSYTAFGTRVMTPAYLQVHPHLEEVSSTCGVPSWPMLRRILFPLVAPSLLRVWLWVLVHSIREAPMAIMLYTSASQTLAVALWLAWTETAQIGFASALAVLLVAFSAILTFFVARLTLFRPSEEVET